MHRDVRVLVRLGGAGGGRRSDAQRVAVAPGEPAAGMLFGVRLSPASQKSCLYAGFGTGLWTELLGRLSLLFGVSGGRRRGCPTSEDVEPSRTVTPTPASKIRVSERGSANGHARGICVGSRACHPGSSFTLATAKRRRALVGACSPQRQRLMEHSASCSAMLLLVMRRHFMSTATRVSHSSYSPGLIESGAATKPSRPASTTSCTCRVEFRTPGGS